MTDTLISCRDNYPAEHRETVPKEHRAHCLNPPNPVLMQHCSEAPYSLLPDPLFPVHCSLKHRTKVPTFFITAIIQFP
ncbi:hypothetical protein [Moorena sp. SIO4G3]|uniref:hypothetical protein n=1 Tax=Moorena sp. SIO4G3 TaxID=2607821 RepID=UPI001429D990|nr:hypothetical protein [Moorena sp. SIO4G3]NEO77823.1 hypothetical protein [Moorena sp. SIO4G3]